jgi:hypothetical protein
MHISLVETTEKQKEEEEEHIKYDEGKKNLKYDKMN